MLETISPAQRWRGWFWNIFKLSEIVKKKMFMYILLFFPIDFSESCNKKNTRWEIVARCCANVLPCNNFKWKWYKNNNKLFYRVSQKKSPLKFGRGCASSMEIRITSREDNLYVYKPWAAVAWSLPWERRGCGRFQEPDDQLWITLNKWQAWSTSALNQRQDSAMLRR